MTMMLAGLFLRGLFGGILHGSASLKTSPPGIGVHSGRPARPVPSPKRPDTFNFGPARPNINFGPCRAGPRADPSAHGPARIQINVPGFKRVARNTRLGPKHGCWSAGCRITLRGCTGGGRTSPETPSWDGVVEAWSESGARPLGAVSEAWSAGHRGGGRQGKVAVALDAWTVAARCRAGGAGRLDRGRRGKVAVAVATGGARAGGAGPWRRPTGRRTGGRELGARDLVVACVLGLLAEQECKTPKAKPKWASCRPWAEEAK
jgi:hypothetical protein